MPERELTDEEEAQRIMDEAEGQEGGEEESAPEAAEEPAPEEPAAEATEAEEPDSSRLLSAEEERRRADGLRHALTRARREHQQRFDQMQQVMTPLVQLYNEVQAADAAIAADQQERPIPTVEEDVPGHIVESLRREIDPIRQRLEAFEQAHQQTEVSQQERQLQEFFQKDAEAFRSGHADYGDAAKHLADALWDDIQRFNPGAPETQIHQSVMAHFEGLGRRAVQAGASPAEEIYRLAQKLGYQAQESGANGSPSNGKSRIQKTREAIKDTRSLSVPGRSASSTPLPPAQDMMSLPRKDLDKIIESMGEQEWAAHMLENS